MVEDFKASWRLSVIESCVTSADISLKEQAQ
jgi:hypothetical protein